MDRKISLTGIKPTGMPHLGNYMGAIAPALELAQEYHAHYFIADYHALNSVRDAHELRQMTYEVAATWIACGLDPEKVLFYRQSDVPETFELTTMLMAFTAKGLMNRAHAYKALVQANVAAGKDHDFGVNMGLYTYPILMAADILLFDAHVVPVGKDQVQHLEMAADIAQTINANYKDELLRIPRAITHTNTALVIGQDGRKMSKSYNNTIPLFIPQKQFRKKIMKIQTNSQEIHEVKDPQQCSVFALYSLFATQQQQEDLAARYRAGGMGWGEAKTALYEVLEEIIGPKRAIYNELMGDTAQIDAILQKGAEKAREKAAAKISQLRKAMGFN
ncbi:tryptophan--tRNA ligase [Chitinivibrio alkaliphilus]|uniref:Tryptophan--tRNA ligase n=1 Tax=Chitinivibrio alkaliphilus ACht1 TaxID=1313304 RepID=U7DAL9_9BACT|nr:tryptophan--tRNA ligase [Chitinivibrio alkaliphilus]ERP39077.1 Tryptophanyl-tRNA synthetase [Chitinivibrio alkaliphilus ACht1]